MNNTFNHIGREIKNYFQTKISNIKSWFGRNQFQIIALLALIFIFKNKDISFSLEMNAARQNTREVLMESEMLPTEKNLWQWLAKLVKKLLPLEPTATQHFSTNTAGRIELVSVDKTEEFGLFPLADFAEKKLSAEELQLREKRLNYVEQYAEVAQAEMKKYGIPASIKLAQGLVETNAGDSKLAVQNHNHFGIKCFTKSCKKGHCSNFSDDTHKDFFRNYGTVWESYRAHSLMLQNPRYRHLFELEPTDYKGWAYGLKSAGYATDKKYAEKLVELIEDLKLYEYDRR